MNVGMCCRAAAWLRDSGNSCPPRADMADGRPVYRDVSEFELSVGDESRIMIQKVVVGFGSFHAMANY